MPACEKSPGSTCVDHLRARLPAWRASPFWRWALPPPVTVPTFLCDRFTILCLQFRRLGPPILRFPAARNHPERGRTRPRQRVDALASCAAQQRAAPPNASCACQALQDLSQANVQNDQSCIFLQKPSQALCQVGLDIAAAGVVVSVLRLHISSGNSMSSLG